jgi:hypothetical protein
MKLVRFPFILGALVASNAAAHAQFGAPPSSHSYTTVDPYGNRTTTTVQTPLADAKSVPGLIAGQGVLGSRTTSSTTLSHRNGYGRPGSNRYRPTYPNYPYPAPAPYGYPAPYAYPSPYPYPYSGGVTNNYYYPQHPYTIPVGPDMNGRGPSASITVLPSIPSYGPYAAPPLYPTYPYPGVPYPAPAYPSYPYPAYGGSYIFGSGNGSIESRSQSSGYGLSVGKGGIRGGFNNNRTSTSTTITTY